MAKFVNSSPLEENENQFIWQNIYYTEFEKTLTNSFDRFYDNSITGDLDSDTESKINYSLENEKHFVHLDEPFKATSDLHEGLLLFNNTYFNFINYYKNNSNYLDTKFKESFQKGFKESSIDLFDIDFEKLYFLPNKKKNIASLNKLKKKHFLIKKVNKIDKESNNSTNEKIDEKKESGNIYIIISNNGNTEKRDINIIGNNRDIFKVISEKSFNIFNYGEYDDYSKRMINEALNENNKQPDNLFAIKKYKCSKISEKRLKNKHRRKNDLDLIRKKIKTRFHKTLKDTINEKLKLAGSKNSFEYLPQSFITNTAKEYNISFLNLTLEEILKTNLFLGKDNKESTLEKYRHNLLVLNYLEKNKEISKKSNFNNIKKMKFNEIYGEYLNSKEFKIEISKLKQQNETEQYIKKYIILAINLIDDFYC